MQISINHYPYFVFFSFLLFLFFSYNNHCRIGTILSFILEFIFNLSHAPYIEGLSFLDVVSDLSLCKSF